MVRVLLRKLLLRVAKVDMLVSGAYLVICKAVSWSCGCFLGLPLVHCWSLAMQGAPQTALWLPWVEVLLVYLFSLALMPLSCSVPVGGVACLDLGGRTRNC